MSFGDTNMTQAIATHWPAPGVVSTGQNMSSPAVQTMPLFSVEQFDPVSALPGISRI